MAGQETNKHTIDTYKEYYEYYTGKASEINRSLALGGIAIVWIFKVAKNDLTSLPNELVTPVKWLAAALCLDLLQYIVAGLIWYFFYKSLEKKIAKQLIQADADVKASKWLPFSVHILYWSKIISNIVAYIYLFIFLNSALFTVNNDDNKTKKNNVEHHCNKSQHQDNHQLNSVN